MTATMKRAISPSPRYEKDSIDISGAILKKKELPIGLTNEVVDIENPPTPGALTAPDPKVPVMSHKKIATITKDTSDSPVLSFGRFEKTTTSTKKISSDMNQR